MSRIKEKVDSIVSSLDVGIPIYTLNFRQTNISVSNSSWKPTIDDSDFVGSLVKKYINRRLDLKNRRYNLNTDELYSNIGDHSVSYLREIFSACSPYSEPRRTNVYKDFMAVINANQRDAEFQQAAFDLCEYYWNQTRTESIRSKNNDVHRTNIYNLLLLMEKRYGKKSSNQ